MECFFVWSFGSKNTVFLAGSPWLLGMFFFDGHLHAALDEGVKVTENRPGFNLG